MTAPAPPSASSPWSRRVRFAASYGALRVAARLSRRSPSAVELATSFALHALDRADRVRLTVALREPARRHSSLQAPELAWLTAELPQPPARVLLGDASQGAMTRWLSARGYAVTAFDPTRDLAHLLAGPPYEAAVLAADSFAAVLDERAQDALLEALASLVPRGPLLAAVRMAPPHARTPAAALGARLGRAVGPAPHAYPVAHPRVCCTPDGFAFAFDRSRLEQLAARACRTLALHEGAAVHASFR